MKMELDDLIITTRRQLMRAYEPVNELVDRLEGRDRELAMQALEALIKMGRPATASGGYE